MSIATLRSGDTYAFAEATPTTSVAVALAVTFEKRKHLNLKKKKQAESDFRLVQERMSSATRLRATANAVAFFRNAFSHS